MSPGIKVCRTWLVGCSTVTVIDDQAKGRAGTPVAPLTSVEVRDQLESLLERDLLGPWDGPEEELAPGTSPAERYLLGRLVPHAPQPGARSGDIRAWKLATTSFPAAVVPLVVPGEWTPGPVLDMARLGSPELARDELAASAGARLPDLA